MVSMRCLVALALSAVLLHGVSQDPVVRDAGIWPFSASSPWNLALGDKAAFQPIASPRFAIGKGGSLNAVGFSHPVYLAVAGDPEVRIFRRGVATPFATVRVPVDARPDAMGDGHLHIVDEQHRSVVEMWQAVRNADGSITAAAVVSNDLTDDGVYPNWHGVRAYGGSAVAGLIRRGELIGGIRHALAIAVEQAALNRNGPGGKGYVWPASSCDNNNAYGSTGNIFMGSLLAIPPTVDVRASGLRGPALEMAIALQDYGAYITDCTGSNLSFYAEAAAVEEAAQVGRGDVAKLVSLLQVVTNNTLLTIGGGGKRRRPDAPAFAPPGMRITDGGLPPVITAEPQGMVVQAGAEVRMVVQATGSEPLAYRWRRSGVAVGNTAELVLASAKPGDSGQYTCMISNAYGRVVSTPIRVNVTGEAEKPFRPAEALLTAWNLRLQTAVRASVQARRVPQYRSELLRDTVSIRDMSEDGEMTIAMKGGATLQVDWKQLHDPELASLAIDLARGDAPAQHAMAAFFLLLTGDQEAARIHLGRSGAEAAAVEAAFVR